MKKTITISAIALLMSICISCQKESDYVPENIQGPKFTATAIIVDNGTRVSLAEDGTSLKPTWEIGDIIIGFDGTGGTYGFSVTAVNEGKATLSLITEGENAGSVITAPADETNMYMFYAPGKKPSDISEKSLTVSIANQSKDVVPALMMASGEVTSGNLTLAFENKTAIVGIKNPTMGAASTDYTSIALSGTGINTEVVFSLSGATLQATYQTAGTITKAVELTSDGSKAVDGVTYIVACPLTSSSDLTFTTNNNESFSKTGKTMAAGNYYYMTPTFVAGLSHKKFIVGTIIGGTTMSFATNWVHPVHDFTADGPWSDYVEFIQEGNSYYSSNLSGIQALDGRIYGLSVITATTVGDMNDPYRIPSADVAAGNYYMWVTNQGSLLNNKTISANTEIGISDDMSWIGMTSGVSSTLTNGNKYVSIVYDRTGSSAKWILLDVSETCPE